MEKIMPKQRRWRVLETFTWSPRANVVMEYIAGGIVTGLTAACVRHAGERIEEIRSGD